MLAEGGLAQWQSHGCHRGWKAWTASAGASY